ncbi:MAG: cysteine--tRNA ligase, partial [Patescibacteria group bacterium]
MKLFNTLSKKIEELKPLHDKSVSFYACGPTVYDYTHIGHIRTYVNVDIL